MSAEPMENDGPGCELHDDPWCKVCRTLPPAPRALWACVHCNRACLPSEEICPWCGKASGVLDSAPREPGVDHEAARKAAESIIDSGVTGMGIQTLARAYLALRVPAAPAPSEPTREGVVTMDARRAVWEAGKTGIPYTLSIDDVLAAVSTLSLAAPVSGEPCAWCNPRIEHQQSCPDAAAPSRGSEVSEAMVKAGALAYFTATCKEYGVHDDWNRVSQRERDQYLADARIVLTAALRAGGPTHG